MSSRILLRADTGAVARLTLNAPKRLNALSDAMLAALQTEFDLIASTDKIKAVILCGEGKVFCAGHDLKEMIARKQDGASYYKDLFHRCSDMMQSIVRLPQPVIAEVHGVATAAGCQLVASCDLAVAAQGTKFGVNGVNIGLFCSTPSVALSRNIPRKQAFEMLSTGQFIDADRAAELGLVNRVVAAENLKSETDELAETIASKLGSAVAVGKRAFYSQMEMSLEEAYAYAGDVMVQNMLQKDTEEGICAFLEKRVPDWQR